MGKPQTDWVSTTKQGQLKLHEVVELEIKIHRIIRSARKTVGLLITEDAHLIVRAPYGISNQKIMDIVQRKSKWIEKKQGEIRKRKTSSPAKELAEGEILYYLGKPYRIAYKDNPQDPVAFKREISGNVALIDSQYKGKKEQTLKLLVKFYRRKTRKEIEKYIIRFAHLYNLHYKRLKISRANKRLGSCSSIGNINFSWRLSMAPPEVIEYIVIHELAHLKEQNHSKRFWKLVEEMMPTYKTYREWIKKNYHLLKLPTLHK